MISSASPAERAATSNAWAFMHWLRMTGRAALAGWEELTAFSAAHPLDFADAMTDFAGGSFATLKYCRSVAEVLLHADLRPDDRVLVIGGKGAPWKLARLYGTEVNHAGAPAGTIPLIAATQRASVLIADRRRLADAFGHTRPALPDLRLIVALGGPADIALPDVLVLARAGHDLWGNALEPRPASQSPPLRFFGQELPHDRDLLG